MDSGPAVGREMRLTSTVICIRPTCVVLPSSSAGGSPPPGRRPLALSECASPSWSSCSSLSVSSAVASSARARASGSSARRLPSIVEGLELVVAAAAAAEAAALLHQALAQPPGWPVGRPRCANGLANGLAITYLAIGCARAALRTAAGLGNLPCTPSCSCYRPPRRTP